MLTRSGLPLWIGSVERGGYGPNAPIPRGFTPDASQPGAWDQSRANRAVRQPTLFRSVLAQELRKFAAKTCGLQHHAELAAHTQPEHWRLAATGADIEKWIVMTLDDADRFSGN